jgi:hypothetical protein
MPKKSPKQQPRPAAETAPESVQTPAPAKNKAPPPSVKNWVHLTRGELKKRRDYLEDSIEIERQFWRLTN